MRSCLSEFLGPDHCEQTVQAQYCTNLAICIRTGCSIKQHACLPSSNVHPSSITRSYFLFAVGKSSHRTLRADKGPIIDDL